ncbi:hypothetical protein ACVDG5_019120 [Mesorhizobium sp. ORM6]
MPSTFFGNQILHDLDLLLTATVFAGSDVHALECAFGLGLCLLAAITRLIEIRVVHVLRHQRECVFLLGVGLSDRQGGRGDRSRQKIFLHQCSSVCCVHLRIFHRPRPAEL